MDVWTNEPLPRLQALEVQPGVPRVLGVLGLPLGPRPCSKWGFLLSHPLPPPWPRDPLGNPEPVLSHCLVVGEHGQVPSCTPTWLRPEPQCVAGRAGAEGQRVTIYPRQIKKLI